MIFRQRVLYFFRYMMLKIKARMPYLVLVAGIIVLDRWTKWLIHNRFDLNESTSLIDGLFDITYVQNTGVAFGIFSSIASPVKATLLSVFTAVAALIVIVYSVRRSALDRLLQLALALILGGALGNLYDRITLGYVIDFLDFYVGTHHWPTFNVADSAISVGVMMLAWEIFRHEAPGRA